jgi:hypothetical protein
MPALGAVHIRSFPLSLSNQWGQLQTQKRTCWARGGKAPVCPFQESSLVDEKAAPPERG